MLQWQQSARLGNSCRSSQYIEEDDIRAPVQCGFREGYGTLDALFVMQHLITKHRFINKVLYVCYVDF
jgi:hypothetical protein